VGPLAHCGKRELVPADREITFDIDRDSVARRKCLFERFVEYPIKMGKRP
jgi:hypothetical protein